MCSPWLSLTSSMNSYISRMNRICFLILIKNSRSDFCSCNSWIQRQQCKPLYFNITRNLQPLNFKKLLTTVCFRSGQPYTYALQPLGIDPRPLPELTPDSSLKLKQLLQTALKMFSGPCQIQSKLLNPKSHKVMLFYLSSWPCLDVLHVQLPPPGPLTNEHCSLSSVCLPKDKLGDHSG